MGDNRLYEYNILYSSSSYGYSQPNFYTTSGKTLIAFLKSTTFKKLEYDEELLDVLLTVLGT